MNIEHELEWMLKDIFQLDFVNKHKDHKDMQLLGKELGMDVLELLYLFTEVEGRFKISIPEEDIAKGRFTTFNNILGIISENI